MSYIGNKPATNFETVQKQISTSNSGTTITLDRAVTSVQDILLTIDAVVQSYDNYSVSGTTLTVGGTLNNNRVEILYVGRTMQSVDPTDDSVSASKIKTDAVTTAKVQNDAITVDKLNLISTSSVPSIEAKGDGSVEGKITWNCENNSHGQTIQASPHSSGQSWTLKLPDNSPTADKFLKVKSITGSGSTATGQLEFADAGGTHALLEAINISSTVSHIDTSAFISSTYKTYLIIGRMFRPVTNSTNVRFRGIEVGGSLMNNSNYNYQEFYSLDSGTGRNYNSSASYVQITNSISSSVDNGAFNFALYFNCDRATSSDAAMTYYWHGGGATGGDAIYSAGGGWYDGVISNDPPEKLRFYFDNGNIHSGKITIYGITGAL